MKTILEHLTHMAVETQAELNYCENAHLGDSTLTFETFEKDIQYLKERQTVLEAIKKIVQKHFDEGAN